MEHISDTMEVVSLNIFFEVNYDSYYVKLEDNRYVKVIGVDEYGNTFKVL